MPFSAKDKFSQFFPIAQAIEILFHPYVEVVIHDLGTERIAAIFNSYSRRKIGDPSWLESGVDWDKEEVLLADPYEKRNWNQKRIKSMSSVLRDVKGKPIGLLCLNLDVSKFEALHQVLGGFLTQRLSAEKPEPLFKDDWQERINAYVRSYILEHHLSLEALDREQKRELIEHLYEKGAFEGKNAAEYVGNVLGIARATVYNYLTARRERG